MPSLHRLEVVAYRADAHEEAWSNPDGSVCLVRKASDRTWRAYVDQGLVIDTERWGPRCRHPSDAMLTARTAAGLAALLAVQDKIHLVFQC